MLPQELPALLTTTVPPITCMCVCVCEPHHAQAVLIKSFEDLDRELLMAQPEAHSASAGRLWCSGHTSRWGDTEFRRFRIKAPP
eukprot:5389976-Amphidinium_carterae.1